ncbi:MAG: hypothetical protein PWP24_1935 [Clostridiales bacterium]|nr:hypothetical protein [Clostridiales bacterium]
MTEMTYRILDSIHEGIIIMDRQMNIIYWNQQMERIQKREKNQVLNKSIFEAMPAFQKKCFQDALKQVGENGALRFFSAAMHPELVLNGEYFNLKIERIKDCDGKLLLLEFTNVSSQILQIQELKTYVKDLMHANQELREKERIIKDLAYHDTLTRVANRTLFYKIADHCMMEAKQNQSIMGLMFIDVNKFKNINDTFGHEIGDQILVRVADMLVKATREQDIVARYGGDEFLILLTDLKDVINYEIIASRIINFKNKPLVIDGNEIPISLSMGVSFYPYDADSIDKLIIEADKAMYVAKRMAGVDNCFSSVCNM